MRGHFYRLAIKTQARAAAKEEQCRFCLSQLETPDHVLFDCEEFYVLIHLSRAPSPSFTRESPPNSLFIMVFFTPDLRRGGGLVIRFEEALPLWTFRHICMLLSAKVRSAKIPGFHTLFRFQFSFCQEPIPTVTLLISKLLVVSFPRD
jgi:hypothetical protein